MALVVTYTGGVAGGTVIQFVDQITTSPTVRLDLNNEQPFMVTGWDISPPPLRRSMSSTMLADGDLITAARHGNKTVSLTLELSSDAGADAASAALQQLGQELNRDMNILRIVLGSHTTFYRVYRSPDYTLQMLDTDGELWQQQLSLQCEPYGLGLPVQIPTATPAAGSPNLTRVSTDPAYTGTDKLPGRFIDVDGVVGDVETPLMVTFQPSAGLPNVYALSVRRGGNPALVGHVLPAETAYFYGADTTVASSHDAVMSGTGNNYAHVTFTTLSVMYERVDFQFPAVAGVEARGAYRVFARVRRTSNADVITMQANYGGVAFPVIADVPANGGAPQVVDLGVINVPVGNDPLSSGMSSTQLPISPDILRVQASRTSGTATLDIDYMYLMPADDLFGAFSLSTAAAGTFAVIDGYSEALYQVTQNPDSTTAAALTPATHVVASGALPMVSPGTNRLYVMGPISSDLLNATDALTAYTDVWLTYWPRFLTLATT